MSIFEDEKKVLQILRGKQIEHIIQDLPLKKKKKEVLRQWNLEQALIQKVCLIKERHVYKWQGVFVNQINSDFFIETQNQIIFQQAMIIDFGTAKQISKEAQTNQKGTFLYMATGVITGEDYDQQVDNWSLGTIFYEILTNETFFDKNNTEYLQQREIIQIAQCQINIKLENKEKIKHQIKAKRIIVKNDCSKIRQ